MNKTKQSVRCEVMKQDHEFLIQEDESDSKERHALKNRAKEYFHTEDNMQTEVCLPSLPSGSCKLKYTIHDKRRSRKVLANAHGGFLNHVHYWNYDFKTPLKTQKKNFNSATET